jgi:hypothetical protein
MIERSLRLTALSFGLLVSPAAAQRITLTPRAGFFAPLRDQVRSISFYCDYGVCDSTYMQARFTSAPALDLTGSVVWPSGFGLEAAFSTAVAWRRTETFVRDLLTGGDRVYRSSSRYWITTAAVRFVARQQLGPHTTVGFGAGPAVTALHPTNGSRTTTHLGAAVSATFAKALTPTTTFDARVVDHHYLSGERPQHDLVAAAGLSFRVGRTAAPEGLASALATLARGFTVTPDAGMHISLAPQGSWRRIEYINFREVPVTRKVSLNPGFSTGVKLLLRERSWYRVEASYSTASRTRLVDAWVEVPSLDQPYLYQRIQTQVRSSMTTLMLSVRRPLGAWGDFTIGTGPARVALSGGPMGWPYYARLRDEAFWGSSLSAAVSLAPVPAARIALAVASTMYSAKFDVDGRFLRGTDFGQHDLVVSLGLALTPSLIGAP